MNVGYYRLAGYWWPLQSDKVNHRFKANSTFENVIQLYNFDRELRILLFDAIERIEIAMRGMLVYHLSHEFNPWWFENQMLFQRREEHSKTILALKEELKRSKDTFIVEHNRKYADDHRLPPAWKALELSSFGMLSKFYGNLKNDIKSKDTIAEHFGAVNHTYLPSWLQSIAQIRNICAHHGRLWNRCLPGTPKLLKSPPYAWIQAVPHRSEFGHLYVHLCIIKYLMDRVSPGHHFGTKLKELLAKYPAIDESALGLKELWKEELLWIV